MAAMSASKGKKKVRCWVHERETAQSSGAAVLVGQVTPRMARPGRPDAGAQRP